MLSRVAPGRPGVVMASTRISARQPAILEYRLAGTPACARGHASEAAATPEARRRRASRGEAAALSPDPAHGSTADVFRLVRLRAAARGSAKSECGARHQPGHRRLSTSAKVFRQAQRLTSRTNRAVGLRPHGLHAEHCFRSSSCWSPRRVSRSTALRWGRPCGRVPPCTAWQWMDSHGPPGRELSALSGAQVAARVIACGVRAGVGVCGTRGATGGEVGERQTDCRPKAAGAEQTSAGSGSDRALPLQRGASGHAQSLTLAQQLGNAGQPSPPESVTGPEHLALLTRSAEAVDRCPSAGR